MTCLKCQHGIAVKAGTTKANSQRFRCKSCGAKFSPPKQNPLGHHRIALADAERVLALLVEGVSLRAISRLTDLDRETIQSLLLTFGAKCAAIFDEQIVGIPSACVQADELWTFVQKKQKRVRPNDPDERGDQWVWIALDSTSKMVLTFHIGKRDLRSAHAFMFDLRRRVAGRPQLTTDGLTDYVPAVDLAFGADVDFAQLIKNYAATNTTGPDWFRPSSRVTSIDKVTVLGNPEDCKISTSYVERANLTMRMHTRRLTRLTNAFSKKLVYLQAAMAIFMTYYNFCRVHQTLRVTPAMEAGLTDSVWTLRDVLTYKSAETRAA